MLSSFSLREERLEVEVVLGPTLLLPCCPPRQSTTDFPMVSRLCSSFRKIFQVSSVSSCPVLSILEPEERFITIFLGGGKVHIGNWGNINLNVIWNIRKLKTYFYLFNSIQFNVYFMSSTFYTDRSLKRLNNQYGE